MKRLLLSAAVVASALAVAGSAAAYITPPGPGDIIPQYCRTGTRAVPVVPANTPLSFWFAYVSKNRGLDMAWIQGTQIELSINGVGQPNLDSYYQQPGDYHWPTSNPLLETLWAIPWVYPLAFQLAPGESFTYAFTTTAEHRLLDGASPNQEGPGNRPYFFDVGTHTVTCTVTAAEP
jgi:hypothetical protein